MIVKILGSAAGGGFPQWNCNAPTSRLAWNRDAGISWRTQSSIALSADGNEWVIVNASPDIRQQIQATPELQPRADGAKRNSPIKAVILTNGDVDHVAGLLSLRERQAFTLYATSRVLGILSENKIFDVLAPDAVERTPLRLDRPFQIEAGGNLAVEAFPVPGKPPLYLEDRTQGELSPTQVEDVIALKVEGEGGGTVIYVPGCAFVDDRLRERVQGADILLFDGTVYTGDELIKTGVGTKTGRRMGHMPISGEGGSLHAFDAASTKRKIYIHINTTNPILVPGSKANEAVREAGWDIASDGMTFTL